MTNCCSPGDDDKAGSLSGTIVFLMATACGCAVSTIYYNQPLLAEMTASFGRPDGEGGLIATLTQIGYAAGLFLFVPLGDRIDRKRLILVLLALNMASLSAVAWAPTFGALVAASFMVGLTAVTAQIIIPAVAALAPFESRGKVIGSLASGLSAGLLFARTVSGFVGAHGGWRLMFVVAVGIGLVLMAIIAWHLPKTARTSTLSYPSLLASLWTLLRTEPVLRAGCITGFFMFAAFCALWGTLATLMARPPYEFGAASVGAFGFTGIAGLVSSPAIGRAVDRFGARAALGAGALVILAAFALIVGATLHVVVLVAAMVMIDIGNRAGLVANQSRIYALSAEAPSRLNTVFMSAYFLGGAAGAGVAGAVVGRWGWVGLAATGAGFALAALIFHRASRNL